MAPHHLAGRFAEVAQEYDRGRPGYPPAITAQLLEALEIAPPARVLDLAAGTGKLGRALLAAGLDLIAVEPQPQMRECLQAAVGPERTLAGVAEAIPLPDGCLEAVAVGDAFHWFEHDRALAEIERVLRARGRLAVITTMWDWSGAQWAHDLGALLASLRPEHPQFDGPSWQEALAARGCWEPVREWQLQAPAPCDAARMADYVASISWVAALPEQARARTLARARALLARESMPATLTVHYALAVTRLAASAA